MSTLGLDGSPPDSSGPKTGTIVELIVAGFIGWYLGRTFGLPGVVLVLFGYLIWKLIAKLLARKAK